MFYLSLQDSLTGKALETPSITVTTSQDLRSKPYDEIGRDYGSDWCSFCYTMAGTARLDNVRELLENIFKDEIEGDFLEAGTWRGGTSIFARAVQVAMKQEDRSVFVCDSFSGLPRSSTARDSNVWSRMQFLSVSQTDVEDHFRRFQMLDERVHFVKGFFSASLPKLRVEFITKNIKLAVLRGDGDMFESYYDILYNLYEFVPVGGYFICDDCPKISVAESAVAQFRRDHNITDPIKYVTGSVVGSYWRKSKMVPVNYDAYLAWNQTRSFSRTMIT